jgi:flagellar biosynthesis protein FliQ
VKIVIVRFLSHLRSISLISLVKALIVLFAAIPLIISIFAIGVTIFMNFMTEHLCEFTRKLSSANK